MADGMALQPPGTRDPRYLGDGVYVANDGHHIVLWLGDGAGPSRPIYLDGRVMCGLDDYLTFLNEQKEEYSGESKT